MKENSQNRIKLSQLKILVAVAEQQSFSEAALDLGISQSAVSHAIASLEEYLGVIIFFRGRYGARLTPVGSRIISHAQIIGEHTGYILREATFAKGLEKGEVHITTFRSIATHILPKAIMQFQKRFPGIKVKLTEHDDYLQVEQAIRAGRADIGITFMPTGKGLTTWEFLKDEFIVLLPPNVQPNQKQLTWQWLSTQPLIMPPVDSIMMRPLYDHINGLGYRLNILNEVKTDAAIVSLVAQGLGGTILPRLAAEPIPHTVNVYSLPVPLERQVGIAILANALQPPTVYALLEILIGPLGTVATSHAPSE
ncbi:LysR family transcriptional regulator [Leptolyngbya cf. ectocarpi LEGE 11479]|uniref:LysR family transcriptional regulator n=1 Tax=Leptolyngbya cf. ectocarpi LEGE 11479 TaxID=1828722 RepID=A0A928X1L6_LEPEC|nr:LysR family transcriptional regulator [Leptolyngbya ectocarpi]MBE9065343.1 LysR family transcriptional regulator [Leptolyngbya cf. ectocarpi LEGE 11479]